MLLSEEQVLIRDTARAFAREQVLPHVRAWEAKGEIPRTLLAEMGRLGFMGMCVPGEWGGAGADFTSYGLALEEIAAGNGGVSTVMSVNNSPVGAALNTYGTVAQKDRFLKPLVRGAMTVAGMAGMAEVPQHEPAPRARRIAHQPPRKRTARRRVRAA